MKRLRMAARVYVAVVIAAGATLSVMSVRRAEFHEPAIFGALLLLGAALATLEVELPGAPPGWNISVLSALEFAALLLVGPDETLIVAALAAFFQTNRPSQERAPVYQTLFGMASAAITVETAGWAFRALEGTTGPHAAVSTLAGPLAGMGAAYFLAATALVATALALSAGEPIYSTWYRNFRSRAPGCFVSLVAGTITAGVVGESPLLLVPLTLVPLYLIYRNYHRYVNRVRDEQRRVKQTADVHLATIEALARAIDARDQSAYTRIPRVQFLAVRLAQAIGLDDAEVEGVKTAALLQDIGTLAVPEHILSKPGPLTKPEFEKIKSHPELGAEIIAAVPFPYPVAPIISSHHEHWDGGGYPQGLRGEAIPLGSRILAIVDYFDAVTTERPHGKAYRLQEAIDLLKREAGSALDPRLVETFIGLLPSLLAERAASEKGLPSASVAGDLVPESPPPADPHQSAFENIALVHRELYALYEIAQPMSTSLSASDTMALISSKLSKIVPWSGCCLFLRDSKTPALKCTFAAGTDVARLLHRTLSGEYSLDSWASRNRRPLVNPDPKVTFESAGVEGPIDLKSALICPLLFNDTPIGVLAVYHVEPNRYTEGHRRLLERVAEQAAIVLHNSLVFERTQEEALTDPLTGLSNRRSIVLHLSQELSRGERLRSPVALILLDIDDFKSINDTCGHNTGDRALCEVASALQGVLRSYDVCGRYGGDEFVLVLPNCTREAAEIRRLELQQRIGRIQIEVTPRSAVTLGASAGVAMFPEDGNTHETLMAAADRRMYQDKANRKRLGPPAPGPVATFH
jgi:diguanylate cyclase (GGDEF)-like protein/putative nucleotidyltransferase with HDIG domain